MTNHYRRGYVAERKCIKSLEELGYTAIRSGGSKKIDICAFLRTDAEEQEQPVIRCIMVTVNQTKAKRSKDLEYLRAMRLPSIVSKELWVWSRGKFISEVIIIED